jgi:hypothetical protein
MTSTEIETLRVFYTELFGEPLQINWTERKIMWSIRSALHFMYFTDKKSDLVFKWNCSQMYETHWEGWRNKLCYKSDLTWSLVTRSWEWSLDTKSCTPVKSTRKHTCRKLVMNCLYLSPFLQNVSRRVVMKGTQVASNPIFKREGSLHIEFNSKDWDGQWHCFSIECCRTCE